jgi:hypothetical protein
MPLKQALHIPDAHVQARGQPQARCVLPNGIPMGRSGLCSGCA